MGGIKRSRSNRQATEAGGRIISRILKNKRAFRTGKGKPVVVTIRYNDKMSKGDFRLKAKSLKQLSREGKLRKTKPVRDQAVTNRYRDRMIQKMWRKHAGDRPMQEKMAAKYQWHQASKAGDGLDPDHVHELQLGGRDDATNLRWMDAYTNRTIGSQIAAQLQKVPYGTPVIIRVVGP